MKDREVERWSKESRGREDPHTQREERRNSMRKREEKRERENPNYSKVLGVVPQDPLLCVCHQPIP